jgi:hypothetical protein
MSNVTFLNPVKGDVRREAIRRHTAEQAQS